MRRRIAVALAAGLIVAMAGGPQAGAQVDGDGGSNTVTATVLAGTRSVSVTAPVSLSGIFGASTLEGSYTVTVAEAVRSGTNPWSLEADITDLVRAGGTEAILDSDMSLTARDVAPGVAVKVPPTAPDGVKDTSLSDTPAAPDNTFADPQILFRIVNQDPAAAYTNVYVGTGDLEADVSSVPAGTYTGTITYTLVQ